MTEQAEDMKFDGTLITLNDENILVDGKEISNDSSSAVHTGADITCSVAPAILVLHAYECGNKDTETATKEVDTTNAGFNLILADDSNNVLNGSYVAKIYKEGTTEKKYKFDTAVESKISLNINGESKGNGKLTVNADNEGIESGLHVTINGGFVIASANAQSPDRGVDSDGNPVQAF